MTHAAPKPLLELQALAKRHGEVPVFREVSLRLEAGEFLALVGDSGVGKSTLLHAVAGLEPIDAGRLWLDGEELGGLDEAGWARLRRERLGFVFQAFHVLPQLTVAENVGLPLQLLGQAGDRIRARVAEMLEATGLDGLGGRMPAQLSGGQLQRVAIARALVHRPRLLLADEPTGNLDPGTAARILDLLDAARRREGTAVLLVTHAEAAAARADRVLRLHPDGLRPGRSG